MKAAEWRKRFKGARVTAWNVLPWVDALLRDFEAAEALNQRLRTVIEDGEKYSEQVEDAAHRLEERCVAAEEERNAAEKRAKVERRHALWVERRYWRDILPAEAEAARLRELLSQGELFVRENRPGETVWLAEVETALAPQERGGQDSVAFPCCGGVDAHSVSCARVRPPRAGGQENGGTDG
jgi:hypothetical protein